MNIYQGGGNWLYLSMLGIGAILKGSFNIQILDVKCEVWSEGAVTWTLGFDVDSWIILLQLWVQALRFYNNGAGEFTYMTVP